MHRPGRGAEATVGRRNSLHQPPQGEWLGLGGMIRMKGLSLGPIRATQAGSLGDWAQLEGYHTVAQARSLCDWWHYDIELPRDVDTKSRLGITSLVRCGGCCASNRSRSKSPNRRLAKGSVATSFRLAAKASGRRKGSRQELERLARRDT